MIALILALALGLTQNGNGEPERPADKGGIEGIVVKLGTGEPIAGARVTLTRQPTPAPARPAAAPAALGPGVTAGAAPAAAAASAPPQVVVSPMTMDPSELEALLLQSRNQVTIPAATSDSEGKFAFKDLEPGAYRMQAAASGFVVQQYGQRNANVTAPAITVNAGQTLTDLAFRLIPTSSIGGRVLDRDRQPLPGIPVQMVRVIYNAQGRRSFQVAGSAVTDDRGRYRIYWINPGRYYLVAGGAAADGGLNSSNTNLVTERHGAQFFPGTPDISGATVIEAQAGVDLGPMDFTLAPLPVYRVRGRVIQADAEPTTYVDMVVGPRFGPAGPETAEGLRLTVGSDSYASGTRGTIDLRGVPPGVYVLSAMDEGVFMDEIYNGTAPASPANASPPRPPVGSIEVTVTDANVEGVILTLAPGASIQGRLRLEGELPAGFPYQRLSLQLFSNSSNRVNLFGNPSVSPTGADGAFRLDNLVPGEYRLTAPSLPPGGYLKEARFGGADALDSLLQFSGDASGTLEVVVSMNGGQLEGVVRDESGKPAGSVQAVLVPTRARDRADRYKIATTDADGRFTIPSIAPGDYKLFSWETSEPFVWFDPEFLRQEEDKGVEVHIGELSRETAVVKLIPRNRP